jgi:uncharacterized membrane protein
MGIKFFLFFWSLLCFFGLFLIFLRTDLDKIKLEANFIFTKGTLFHILIYIIFSIILLPLTIPYSIKHFLNNN